MHQHEKNTPTSATQSHGPAVTRWQRRRRSHQDSLCQAELASRILRGVQNTGACVLKGEVANLSEQELYPIRQQEPGWKAGEHDQADKQSII